MKKDIHPNYKEVIFRDTTTGAMFLTCSTVKTKDTVKYVDGKTYPLYEVEHSSASHPFYTGQHQLIDTAGRIDKFKRRYNIKN